MTRYASDHGHPDDIGQAVRTVGHEIRNKLAVMRNSTYYLRMRVGSESEKVARHLELLESAVESSSRELLDLMDYAMPRQPVLASCSLGACVGRFLEQWGVSQAITIQTPADDIHILADKAQLLRAFECLADALVHRGISCLACTSSVRAGIGLVRCQLSAVCDPPLLQDPDLGRNTLLLREQIAASLFDLNGVCLEFEQDAGTTPVLQLVAPLC